MSGENNELWGLQETDMHQHEELASELDDHGYWLPRNILMGRFKTFPRHFRVEELVPHSSCRGAHSSPLVRRLLSVWWCPIPPNESLFFY